MGLHQNEIKSFILMQTHYFVGTDIKKDSFIKIRIKQEQMELYKHYAESKGISLTELLVIGREELIARDRIKHKELEILEPRLQNLEKKLEEVKKKMEHRRANNVKRFKWFK